MRQSRSSNAHKLEYYGQAPVRVERQPVPAVKKSKKLAIHRRRVQKAKVICAIVAVFCTAFLLCSRYVNIYGLHNEITKRESDLAQLKMNNEQTELAIDAMIDSAKIEEYATSELGMKKADRSQIVYIQSTPQDTMGKIEEEEKESNVIVGAISATFDHVMEYLK